ncbi:MAG: terminase [Rhodospirillales bacterium]
MPPFVVGKADVSADLQHRLIEAIAGFAHDPLGYVMFAFPWGEPGGPLADEEGPDQWQREFLADIGQKLRQGKVGVSEAIRLAASSGHGVGKSSTVVWLIKWAMATRPDTRVVVTANTEGQLKGKTWPELSKWHQMAIDREWFEFTATSYFSRQKSRERTWRCDAVPWSENNTEAFAGLHNAGKRIVLIFDEASAIPDKIWEVAEGALTDEDTEIIWCAFGNPTMNTGRFRECWRRFAHRWATWQIDSRTAKRTNKAQIAQWIADYGEDSDFVKVRVRGMFPSASERQFIGTADVDAAFGRHLREEQYAYAPKILSIDPAWTGADEFVIGLRQGLKFEILRVIPYNDNDLQMASLIATLQDEHKAEHVWIDKGYGTGIYSAGLGMGRHWLLVDFGGAASDVGVLNKRAEMWRAMRDWLKSGGAIPKDQVLYQDLIGPETVGRPDGKLQLETKESMKDRGLPSPNRADCLAISFAYPVHQLTPAEMAVRAVGGVVRDSAAEARRAYRRD